MTDRALTFIQFTDFADIEEIGSGGYGTVYKTTCTSLNKCVVLKGYRNFNQTPELFISEVSNLPMLLTLYI